MSAAKPRTVRAVARLHHSDGSTWADTVNDCGDNDYPCLIVPDVRCEPSHAELELRGARWCEQCGALHAYTGRSEVRVWRKPAILRAGRAKR